MNQNLIGVVNFLKPAGMTSHDAVSFFRRVSGVRRVGHTGTLDPMAAGVLPLCVGRATRITEYLSDDDKRYRCELRLGIRTDTLDVWGRTLAAADEKAMRAFDEADVAAAAASLVGARLQTPPDYSAVKIDGRKLYEYARAGEKPAREPKARPTTVYAVDLFLVDVAGGRVGMDVFCSKGTYVRSLCAEIGDKLGCGAAMSFLLRTASGALALADAYTPEEIEAAFDAGSAGGAARLFRPPDALLPGFAKTVLSEAAGCRFAVGVATPADGIAGVAEGERVRVYAPCGDARRFLGIGRIDGRNLRPEKVFADFGGDASPPSDI